MLTWWVTVSIGVNLIGQLMMSHSSVLYDTFFDFAHVAKLFGYLIPLLGAAFFTIGLLRNEKAMAEKMAYIAHHDALTHIPNRALFHDRFQQEVKLSKRYKRPFSVLLIDLNKFKPINDEYGHLAGDEALKVSATRMQSCLREVDTVARVGGDEFAVILSGASRPDDVSDICEKIIDAITEPFSFERNTLKVGLSIGIATYPYDAALYEDILVKADEAMYIVKYSNRSSYLHYSAGWGQLVSLSNDEIDDEHNNVLISLNEMSAVMQSDKFSGEKMLKYFCRLYDNTAQHFEHEESLFAQRKFPHVKEHTLIHEQVLNKFTAQIQSIKNSNSRAQYSETLYNIRNLLIGHVLKEDIKYVEYLKGYSIANGTYEI